MSLYTVKVVDMFGAILATFATGSGTDPRQTITVKEVTWALNEPGSASITVPLEHPEAGAFFVPGSAPREVQVFRNGSLIFWGVLVQRALNDGYVTWTAPGLLWYFTRRYFGPINLNFLSLQNGFFTTDLSSWTAVGAVATWSNALRLRGPGTAKLVAAASGDNYLKQVFNVSTSPTFGLGIALAGLFYPEGVTEGALDEIGIWVQCPGAAHGTDPIWEPITMNQAGKGIQRVETYIVIQKNLTNTPVEVRLYAPKGTIYWGGVTATAPESIGSTDNLPDDPAAVVGRIINYAQTGSGKSTLNMTSSTPATSSKELVSYQFSELPNIFTSLQTYPARGLLDFEVVITTTTRVFTTYAPRRGTLKSGNAVTVPGNGVIKLGHLLDGQQTATQVVRRGEGSGPDRELGVVTDASGLGGLILQDIGDAPPEATVDSLDSYAAADHARLKNPLALPQVTVAAEGWIGSVAPGDTVPAAINWGAVQDSATKRVVSMTLDAVTDEVDVGFMVA